MKTFKPLKAPNEKTNLNEIKYPLLASTKLDGVRSEFVKDKMLTCSLKNIQNKQLNEKFEDIRKYSEKNNLILDGEIYEHVIPFQFIVSCVMTQDYNDKKAIKKWGELCHKHNYFVSREEVFNCLKFYCFDCVKGDNFDKPYIERIQDYEEITIFPKLMTHVEQRIVNNKVEVESYFEEVLNKGYKGLILRDFKGRYKFGRGTLKEGIIFKIKPWITIDAQIIGVVQSTTVDSNAEKKINELGRSVTSKKKDDRILIEKASAFIVLFNGQEVRPTLKMNDEEKKEVWENKENYIGKWVEYKYLEVGMKKGGLPRHPVFKRFREDKNE